MADESPVRKPVRKLTVSEFISEVRVPYAALVHAWPTLIPTTDRRETQPPAWRWYYRLGLGVLSFSQVANLGVKPETRVRNLLRRTSDLWIVGKIGGSAVFHCNLMSEDTWRGGLEGKVPADIVALFVAAQP